MSAEIPTVITDGNDMGMSPAQYQRLKMIVRSIEVGPTHPSEGVREAFSNVSQAQLENAINRINEVIANNDGFLAHGIIGAFMKPGGGSELNVVRYVNMTLPKPKV